MQKQRAAGFQIPLLLLTILLLDQRPLQASQSMIEQRTNYNSQKQFTESLAGTWGFDEKAFASLALTYAQAPSSTVNSVDTFYQLSPGAGYAFDNIALSGGLNASHSSLTYISSLGGFAALTYVQVPENTDSYDQHDRALNLLHSQIYTTSNAHPPTFWARLAFEDSIMRSSLPTVGPSNASESALLLEASYPYNPDFFIGAGFSLHSYTDVTGLFYNAEKNVTDVDLELFGTTIQGLPKDTAHAQVSWKIAPRDYFLPRYQISLVAFPVVWAHTIDLSWCHEFSKQWFLTPSYELTMQDGLAYTGVILKLLYTL